MGEVVILDIETTGLHPNRGDRIIEIGAIAINGESRRVFHSFINPRRTIPEKARKIHGISLEMLTGQPSPEEALKKFHSFVSDGMLVAHNARFDIRFLRCEFSRLGMSLNNKCYCTMELSRKIFPELPDHRLETVYRHVTGGSENIRVHRALCDAGLAARIWLEFVQRGQLGTFSTQNT